MITATTVAESPNITRMTALQRRAKVKAGCSVSSNDVASILFPRLHKLLRGSACASHGEASCFLRDVIYYGPDEARGGECFTHGGLTARRWLQLAIDNRNI